MFQSNSKKRHQISQLDAFFLNLFSKTITSVFSTFDLDKSYQDQKALAY